MFGFSKGAPNEDRLTASVFGLMRFLADAEFLYPFLDLLANENGRFEWREEQPPDEAELVAWPVLDVPEAFQSRFAKVEDDDHGKKQVVPDALVKLQWHRWGVEGRKRNVDIYVEAEHSKVVEAEQIAQQWAVIRHHRPPATDSWLLLVNRTTSIPWPDAARPEIWAGEGYRVCSRDLLGWCARRVAYFKDGIPGETTTTAPDDAPPRLLHMSWQSIAGLTRRLESRSWPYKGLLAGLRDYLALAGYEAPVHHLDVVEFGAPEPVEDRLRLTQGLFPELPSCDPDLLFSPPRWPPTGGMS